MHYGTKVLYNHCMHIIMLPCISFGFIIIGHSEDRFGAWSTEECREVLRERNRRVCECSQLAHFGILFVNLIEYILV